MKVVTFIEKHARALSQAGIAQAKPLLRQLVAHRLKTSQALLVAYPNRELSHSAQQQLEEDLCQLCQGVPAAYVFGEVPFLNWDFTIDRRALIPRPETEALADTILQTTEKAPSTLLDLCCGSGVLGIALALSFPKTHLLLTDISQDALALAQTNIARHGLKERAKCRHGDLWEAIPVQTNFDLIVANPPYVAPEDALQDSVLMYEPGVALFSESRGLAHIRRILTKLDLYLTPGGKAAFELGHYHQQLLQPFLDATPFRGRFHWLKDPFGVARYLFYDGASWQDGN